MTYEFDGKKYEKASSHQKEWGERIIEELGLQGTGRILDLGCCNRALTVQLSPLVPNGEVVGIDASRGMIEAAKPKDGRNLPWRSVFLGFSFTAKLKREISEKAIKRLKAKVRETTFRTRGVRIEKVAEELCRYLCGWQAYFNFAGAKSIFRE